MCLKEFNETIHRFRSHYIRSTIKKKKTKKKNKNKKKKLLVQEDSPEDLLTENQRTKTDQSQICSLWSGTSEQPLQVGHDFPIQEHLAHTSPKAQHNTIQQYHSQLQQHQPLASLHFASQSHKKKCHIRPCTKRKMALRNVTTV